MAVASMMLWLVALGRQVVYYDSSISGERKWACGLPPAHFGSKIVRETRRMAFLATEPHAVTVHLCGSLTGLGVANRLETKPFPAVLA
jgi:hypothetical protein